VEADGQEHLEKYSLGIIGTRDTMVNITAPTSTLSQIGFVVACISYTCSLARGVHSTLCLRITCVRDPF
jgi:hypothetical protein